MQQANAACEQSTSPALSHVPADGTFVVSQPGLGAQGPPPAPPPPCPPPPEPEDPVVALPVLAACVPEASLPPAPPGSVESLSHAPSATVLSTANRMTSCQRPVVG